MEANRPVFIGDFMPCSTNKPQKLAQVQPRVPVGMRLDSAGDLSAITCKVEFSTKTVFFYNES